MRRGRDYCLILKHDEYRDFIAGKEFKPLCDVCIEDEKAGIFEHSACFEQPLIDAPLFTQFQDWRSSLNATYTGAFSGLVYGDLPTMDDIESALNFIKDNVSSWRT